MGNTCKAPVVPGDAELNRAINALKGEKRSRVAEFAREGGKQALLSNIILRPDDVVKVVVPLLGHAKGTEILDVSGNWIGDAGVTALAEKLPDTSITTLKLGSNQIGVAGVTALAEKLPGTSITTLHLQNNGFGDAGVTALAEKLPGTSITDLHLQSNQFGDGGVTALAEELPGTSITTLCLSGNKLITSAGWTCLLDAIEASIFSLTYLSSELSGSDAKRWKKLQRRNENPAAVKKARANCSTPSPAPARGGAGGVGDASDRSAGDPEAATPA